MHHTGLNFFSGGGLIDGDKELVGCDSCLIFTSCIISCFISCLTSFLFTSSVKKFKKQLYYYSR